MLTGGLYALPFDLLADLEPVIRAASDCRSQGPAGGDLKGLIARLKANPDKASVGIAGVGATGHLAGISFQKLTGTKFQFVPYRGNSPAMQGLLAGQIDFMIKPASNFKALLEAGSVKPFAISPLDQQAPEALRAYQKEEAERWWPIIKVANIRAE